MVEAVAVASLRFHVNMILKSDAPDIGPLGELRSYRRPDGVATPVPSPLLDIPTYSAALSSLNYTSF